MEHGVREEWRTEDRKRIFFFPDLYPQGAPLVAQTLKDLLAMQETQVQSLGWEDPLEKRMA